MTLSVTAARSKQQRRRYAIYSHSAIFLLGCCATTMVFNFYHASIIHRNHSGTDHHWNAFAQKHLQNPQSSPKQQPQPQQSKPKSKHHSVAGLHCQPYGGPSSDIAQEMVYWKDIPNDSHYRSPFYNKNDNDQQQRYLTFEPDGGGWNNIRMSMETVLTMAIATGRTLVLPPSQHMYLLGSTTFSFADFFPLEQIANEQDGLTILTMEQFLQQTNGQLRYYSNQNQDTNQNQNPIRESTTNHLVVAQIPNNRTNWDGDTDQVQELLNPFLQRIAYNPDWNPGMCLGALLSHTIFDVSEGMV